ncbi:hypothetical protein O181_110540, partial [Austropuccinia psidii MF-1]|nr:hypothetical protein [Austropuccinia psidii MF-1]
MDTRTSNRPTGMIPDYEPCPSSIANEGWRWREDIQAWAERHHVLSPMGFKCQ